MASKFINVTLKIWRQKNADSKGKIETYQLSKVSTDSSFLEMLDQLNEKLISEKQNPVAFDHDWAFDQNRVFGHRREQGLIIRMFEV